MIRSKVLNLLAIIAITVCSINAQKALTADVYASYFGGSGSEHLGNDWGSAIGADSLGNVYLVGHTWAKNIPVKSALQNQNAGEMEGFIVKFNPAMTEIVFCTYLGGKGSDMMDDMVVDKSGNIYALLSTTSTNFPTKGINRDSVYNGGEKDLAFVKMNTNGQLIYSTFIGGSGIDQSGSLCIDSDGNVYITGQTSSTDFPLKNALFGSKKGENDAFIISLNTTNNSFNFVTYLGGSGKERGNGIAIDGDKNIFITGITSSTDFPFKNAYDSTYNGSSGDFYGDFGDAFIVKLNSLGNELIYATYLGGSNFDEGTCIQADKEGNAIITGTTRSAGIPCSDKAVSKSLKGTYDAFLAKIGATGKSLDYCSYIGGNALEYGQGLGYVDQSLVYIFGTTRSTDFTTTSLAYQNKYGGQDDTYEPVFGDNFLSIISMDNETMLYSTYIGGNSNEGLHGSFYLSDSSNAYMAGYSSSTNFPVSSDAYKKTFQSSQANPVYTDATLMRFIFREDNANMVKKTTGSNDITIFPNPTKGLVTLSLGITKNKRVLVEVYNLQGAQVFSKTFQNTPSATIDLTGNSAGIYVVRVIAEGACYEQKILKE